MTSLPGTGAMDQSVGLDDQLRADVHYERPPHGGRALFDLLGDIRGRRILDLGCGLAPYRRVLEAKGASWVGLELVGPACTVIGDGDQLPFRDGAFDGVLCAAVLEHMPEPGRTVAEARRVLTPGGKLFGYVSFLEPFHGLSYYHMSHLGLEHLLSTYGFRPSHIFAPENGTAYQIECMLFPRHVPVVKPMFRWVAQGTAAALLATHRLMRRIVRSMRGIPENREDERRYRQLLALRFGVGFNFIAERVDMSESGPTGYRALVREG